MKLKKRLKKPRKKLKTKILIKNIKSNPITGYGAKTDPICNVCKRHKPLNWHVKICADIICTGKYVTKRKKLKNYINK